MLDQAGHRLSAVRASLRLVSTPACRSARAVSSDRYDAIDHVMTYFFRDQSGMTGFLELAKALSNADRKLPLLPPVERGIYQVEGKAAAARVKVGADVLPWWPVRGMYVLLEANASAPTDLTEVDGVAGVWSGTSQAVDARLASAPAGQTISYCFLDEDPVQSAERLRPALEKRDDRMFLVRRAIVRAGPARNDDQVERRAIVENMVDENA